MDEPKHINSLLHKLSSNTINRAEYEQLLNYVIDNGIDAEEWAALIAAQLHSDDTVVDELQLALTLDKVDKHVLRSREVL